MARDGKNKWYLKAWRKKRGLSQDQLAELAGTSKGYVSDFENGKRRYNEDMLEAFADALGCEARDLLIDPEVWEFLRQLDLATRSLDPDRKAKTLAMVRLLSATGTEG